MKWLTLTFDNGPATGSTECVLRTLDDRGLQATFFMVGNRVAGPAGWRTAQRVRDAGHAIGNHTLSHCEPLGTVGTEARVNAEIGGAHQALRGVLHGELLLRPTGHGTLGPHLLSEAAVAYLAAHQYTVVTWNAVPRDWEAPSDSWVARAHRAIEDLDWTVLVLHDDRPAAGAYLATFLDGVVERGVEIRSDFPPTCIAIRRGCLEPPIERLTTPPPSVGRSSATGPGPG